MLKLKLSETDKALLTYLALVAMSVLLIRLKIID